MKKNMPLGEARKLALKMVGLLTPYCERVEIAGSIRRQKPSVGDIEIVAKPKLVVDQMDMFNDGFAFNRTMEYKLPNELLQLGDKLADGPRYKKVQLHEGIQLDLFIVLPPATWGVIFTLRTGDEDFSHNCVKSWLEGGYLPVGYRVKDGQLWKGSERIPTEEEEDFLRVMELENMPPEARIGAKVFSPFNNRY